MKFGDKRECTVVNFTGDRQKDVLSCFKKLEEDQEEQRIIDLKEKQRAAKEAAKKRF